MSGVGTDFLHTPDSVGGFIHLSVYTQELVFMYMKTKSINPLLHHLSALIC